MNARVPGYGNSNITIRVSVTDELWKSLEKDWNNIKSKFDDNGLTHKLLDDKGKFPRGQQIFLYKKDTDATDEGNWQQQFGWFILNFWKFAEIFREHFCCSLEPFERPFEFNKPGREPEREHFEENVKELVAVVKKEIEFLDKQISHLSHRKSELQRILSNYE